MNTDTVQDIASASKMDDYILDISEGQEYADISVKIHPKKADEFIKKFWKKNGKDLKQRFYPRGKKKGEAQRKKIEAEVGGREKIYANMFSAYAEHLFINNAPRRIMMMNDYRAYEGEDRWWLIKFKSWLEPTVVLDSAILKDEALSFSIPDMDVEFLVAEKIKSFTILNPYLSNKTDAQGDGLPASENDMIEISSKCIVDGNEFKQGDQDGTRIRLIKDTITPPELYNTLLNKKAGDEFTLDNIDGSSIPMLKDMFSDKKVCLNIKVIRVYTCSDAKINDDMAITAGFENLDKWKISIRDTYNRRINTYKEQMKMTSIIKHLMKNTPIADFSKSWQEAKVRELIKDGRLGKIDDGQNIDRFCAQINEVAKQNVLLKYAGEKLGIEYEDKDKHPMVRDEGAYAMKVLKYLVGKAKFEYVTAETTPDGGGNRESNQP